MVRRYAKAQLPTTFMTRRAMLKTSIEDRVGPFINSRVDESFDSFKFIVYLLQRFISQCESVCRQGGPRCPLQQRLLLVAGKTGRCMERRIVPGRHRPAP